MRNTRDPSGPSLASMLVALFVWPAATSLADSPMQAEKLDGVIRVRAAGQPFADYHLTGYVRPIVYPIYGPGQISMTRNYPMRNGIAGEATDHIHHRSLWFGHQDIGGVSFWHETKESGRIELDKLLELRCDKTRIEVRTANRWVAPDGRIVCTDTTVVAFAAAPDARWIDWSTTLHASHGALKLGDAKDGTMAVRVHPNLRLDRRAADGTPGQMINSEGLSGDTVWSRRADWVDYWGKIDGQTVGIAMFDHPTNLRHPTYWHARGYGLFAANPFGVRAFSHGKQPSGTVTLAAGQSLTLRYRILFHRGNSEEAQIAKRYAAYAAGER